MASRLQDVIQRGTAASRPLATAVAPGTLYFSTDTGTTDRSDGTNWETYADISSVAGWVKIAEQTPSGVGLVTFSALGLYTHLKIFYSARGTAVATATAMDGSFNGDTGANYDRQNINAAAAVVTSSESLAQTVINQIAVAAAANAPAGSAGCGEITIMDYRGTTFHKRGHATFEWAQDTISGTFLLRSCSFGWRSTAAITSITLALQSGNFVAGSKFSLYGLT